MIPTSTPYALKGMGMGGLLLRHAFRSPLNRGDQKWKSRYASRIISESFGAQGLAVLWGELERNAYRLRCERVL
jgi:hypothetical protein